MASPWLLACLLVSALQARVLLAGPVPKRMQDLQAKPFPKQAKGPWADLHNQYVAELKQAKDLRLVFFGDSITEYWRGRSRGRPRPAHAGVKAVWRQHFEGKAAAAFGISGDLTSHLQWRLLNGETPPSLKPEIVVMHIGTNDLGACDRIMGCRLDAVAESTAANIMNVARTLHRRIPSAKVVIVALLPRGSYKSALRASRGDFYDIPSRFSSSIEKVNKQIEAEASTFSWISYLDCSEAFLSQDKTSINQALMPDALHPSVDGYAKFAECLLPALEAAWPNPVL